MNALAEALGMALPGSAAIPAPYRERSQMAYKTGTRIVEMVHEDLKPCDISRSLYSFLALSSYTKSQLHTALFIGAEYSETSV